MSLITKFKNPIIAASGCFSYGYEFGDMVDINNLGGISLKGTTLEKRRGNKGTRICDTSAGMINSIGLQNDGVHKLIEYHIPKLRAVYDGVVISNICGFSMEEYIEVAKLLDQHVDMHELNVSCPNVKEGCISFGTDINMLSTLIKEVKKVATKEVIVKLSPVVNNPLDFAKAIEAAGADGIVIANTFLAMDINLSTKKPTLNNIYGGLSGPGVFPLVLKLVYDIYPHINIPIIAVGGISNSNDVEKMFLAGASYVEVGTAILNNPMLVNELHEDLKNHELITGGAHDNSCA